MFGLTSDFCSMDPSPTHSHPDQTVRHWGQGHHLRGPNEEAALSEALAALCTAKK